MIPSNPHLARSASPNELSLDRSAWAPIRLAKSLYEGTLGRGIAHAAYQMAPSENPAEILRRIDSAAEEALKKTKKQGIVLDPKIANLQGDLENLLQKRTDAHRLAIQKASQVGEMADLSPLPKDPEVTRVPLLKDRMEEIDWEDEKKLRQSQLAEKISIFSTLLQMKERSGCGTEETNNLELMGLVRKATEGEKTSVWKLFTSHYDLTFFQLLQAAWFYIFYYQTSLISNTVNAYLDSFVQNMNKDLAKESSNTRAKLFQTILENTHEFLIDDIQATKDFSLEKKHGAVDKYRDKAIERSYGYKSLLELCSAFSENRVEKYSPTVPFFKEMQNIPGLGLVFWAFEWLVNRFIIQRTMKYIIMPKALASTVEKGLQATQPHNLPFALSLVRFLNQRMKKLLLKVQNSSNEELKETEKLPGTDLLPDTIKSLKKVLALEGIHDPLELRLAFEKLEKKKTWLDWLRHPIDSILDPKIDPAIEMGICEAGHLLFKTLDEIAQSGELSAKVLELAADPFTEKVKDKSLLLTEYNEEQAKLQVTAKDLFDLVIKKAVSEKFNGGNFEISQKKAEELFQNQKETIQFLIDKIGLISRRMAEKINGSAEEMNENRTLLSEIASILQIMRVLGTRKGLRELPDDVQRVDQNTIWKTLNPLFNRFEKLLAQVIRLQELEDSYPGHAWIPDQFKAMGEIVQSIRLSLNSESKRALFPLVEQFSKKGMKILEKLEQPTYLSASFKGYESKLSNLSKELAKEEKAIEALYSLYPPRSNRKEGGAEGLLDHLIQAEMGTPPAGFRYSICLDAIKQRLADLPKKEGEEIGEEGKEIGAIIGDGRNLKRKWAELSMVLERVLAQYVNRKKEVETRLEELLDQAETWIQDKERKFTIVKEKDFKEIKSEMKRILKETQELEKKASESNLNLPKSLSPMLTRNLGRGFGLGASLAGGYAGSMIMGPVGGPIGSFLGGALAKITQGVTAHPVPNRVGETLVAKGSLLALGGLASQFLPSFVPAAASWSPWGVAATAGAFGWNAVTGALAMAETKVNTQVMDIFTKAHSLMYKPRIYKAATTRAMKSMITGN